MKAFHAPNLFANNRHWSGIRYQIYAYMDFRLNERHFNIRWIISFLYNVLYFLIPLSALTPMVMNYVLLQGDSFWTGPIPFGSAEFTQLQEFVHQIGLYFYVEYFFLFFFLIDFFLRWLIADYQSIKKNWKAFLKYPFNPLNFFEIAVFATLITIYYCEGHFFGNLYIIDIGAFNTNPIPAAFPAQQITQTWLRAQIVYVALFLGLIFTMFNRVGNRERSEIQGVTFRSFIKKKLKIPLIATVFLVVLILIFSFVILKSEQSYYASVHETPPAMSPETFGQAVWYCFITITTVGYGQYIPQSPAGRVIAVILIFVGTSYYAFYGVFLVSAYTSFLQRKQIERDQEIQNEAEEKKQNLLIRKIRDGVVRDLIQYKVIDKQEYEAYQSEIERKHLAIRQDRVDDANHTAIGIRLSELRFFHFRRSSFSLASLAIVNQWGTIAYEKTFSGNIERAVILPMKKRRIDELYSTNENTILANYWNPNLEQILIYVPEPDNYCFGVLWVTFIDFVRVEDLTPQNGYLTPTKNQREIVRLFGARPAVYKITKKIIYNIPESVNGISGFFSENKFFKIQLRGNQSGQGETKKSHWL